MVRNLKDETQTQIAFHGDNSDSATQRDSLRGTALGIDFFIGEEECTITKYLKEHVSQQTPLRKKLKLQLNSGVYSGKIFFFKKFLSLFSPPPVFELL